MDWMPISEQIDFVFPIPVPTQTLPPHRDTNSYLVGSREIGMIDAGLWDEKGVDTLVSHFGKKTERRLSRLILTHWHPDHLVGADKIKERTGCRVGVHVSEADKVAPLTPDFTFQHGDEIPFDDRVLEVIHTPFFGPLLFLPAGGRGVVYGGPYSWDRDFDHCPAGRGYGVLHGFPDPSSFLPCQNYLSRPRTDRLECQGEDR